MADDARQPDEVDPNHPGASPGGAGFSGPGSTRRLPAVPPARGGAGPADATRRFPAPEEAGGSAGSTRQLPGGAVGPGTAAGAGEAGRWSGRAGVPRPVPASQPAEEWTEEPPPRRSGLMPLLIGLVILLLLALVGYGLWLALRPRESAPAPAPSPTPSAAATSRSPSPSPSPAPPTTTRPATVTVPPLTGLPVDAATAALDQLGLRWTVRREAGQGTPGTVIRTDPGSGSEVDPGSRVTLYVVREPPPSSAPASPSTTPSG